MTKMLFVICAVTSILTGQSSGVFTPLPAVMNTPRHQHTATLLREGRVLIAGGYNLLSSAEIFDPATGVFSATGNMLASNNTYGSATLLADGTVLFIGSSFAELYYPVMGTFATTGLGLAFACNSAVLLGNGNHSQSRDQRERLYREVTNFDLGTEKRP